MRFLTSSGFSRTSKPATVAVPEVGNRNPVSMRIVVVFPAPFGPRKPTISPFATSKEMWSTARLRAYLFVSSLTLIIRISFREAGPLDYHGGITFWRLIIKRLDFRCQLKLVLLLFGLG